MRWNRFSLMLVWLAIGGALYFAFDRGLKPQTGSATLVSGQAQIVIPRSRDGHYYVEGIINNQPITFMVDTGASTIAIDPDVAKRVGLPQGFPTTFHTASGEAVGDMVPNQSITVGGVQVSGLRVGVIPGLGEHGLLGQNFLRYVDVVQSGDQMILRAKAASK